MSGFAGGSGSGGGGGGTVATATPPLYVNGGGANVYLKYGGALVNVAGTLNVRCATTAVNGVVEIATQAQTYAGTPYNMGAGSCPLVPSITNLLIRRQAVQNALYSISTGVAPNARGTNALDFQSNRTAATQVASGGTSVALGAQQTASGTYSVAVGHYNIALGNSSQAIGKGNLAGTNYSTSIGYANTVNTSNAGVALGRGNVVQSLLGLAVGIGSTVGSLAASGVAIGVGAQARIPNTTVLQPPVIAPKTNAITQANAFNQLSGLQNVLYTIEIDFTAAGATFTHTMPAGSRFLIDAVGVIVEELDGTVTTQISYEFGITGTNAKYLAIHNGFALGTLWNEEKWQNLLADAAEASLTFTITTSGVKGTATKYKGKAFWIGRLIETE